MKNLILLGLLSLASLLPAAVSAEDGAPNGVILLPGAHDLFEPLRADPRELQYALRAGMPVAHKLYGDVAMGDYLGIIRWPMPWTDDGQMQLSFGGGVFARFDLAGSRNNMESADFFANLPIDLRYHKWSSRMMVYHTSSHLGDDYITTTGITSDQKHSWDNFRWLISYDWTQNLRLYGGWDYVFRTFPSGLGREEAQGGVEAKTKWMNSGHTQLYWANDLQSWQRVQYNPEFNSQAGVKWKAHPTTNDRAVSMFIEYGAGHHEEGQFFLQEESHWTLGIKFDLS